MTHQAAKKVAVFRIENQNKKVKAIQARKKKVMKRNLNCQNRA